MCDCGGGGGPAQHPRPAPGRHLRGWRRADRACGGRALRARRCRLPGLALVLQSPLAGVALPVLQRPRRPNLRSRPPSAGRSSSQELHRVLGGGVWQH